MPGTVGGRVLGSILYLRGRPKGARFWCSTRRRRRPAASSLYLHHQSHRRDRRAACGTTSSKRSLPGTERSAPSRAQAPMQRLDTHSPPTFERMRAVDNRPYRSSRPCASCVPYASNGPARRTGHRHGLLAAAVAGPTRPRTSLCRTGTRHPRENPHRPRATPSARHRATRSMGLGTRSTRERLAREHPTGSSDLPANRGPNLAAC